MKHLFNIKLQKLSYLFTLILFLATSCLAMPPCHTRGCVSRIILFVIEDPIDPIEEKKVCLTLPINYTNPNNVDPDLFYSFPTGNLEESLTEPGLIFVEKKTKQPELIKSAQNILHKFANIDYAKWVKKDPELIMGIHSQDDIVINFYLIKITFCIPIEHRNLFEEIEKSNPKMSSKKFLNLNDICKTLDNQKEKASSPIVKQNALLISALLTDGRLKLC